MIEFFGRFMYLLAVSSSVFCNTCGFIIIKKLQQKSYLLHMLALLVLQTIIIVEIEIRKKTFICKFHGFDVNVGMCIQVELIRYNCFMLCIGK